MSGPTSVRSIAVTASDVVDAFVYTRENPGTAVVRVTPPFHGRMRARLHVFVHDDSGVTGAIHVPAEDLLEAAVVEEYPGTADPAAHEHWRQTARGAIESAVTIAGGTRVDVHVLGE